MYSMYNCDYDTIKRNKDKIKPFIFSDGQKLRSSFYIDELDMITSRYQSFNSFYNDLLEFGNKYVDGNDLNITIVHESNKDKSKIYYDEVIYNDKLVYLTALETKNNRKDKNKENLSNTDKLSHFIDYIMKIAVSSTSDYLLDPESVEGMSQEDTYFMLSCLKDDFESNNKTVHRGIRSLLIDYRKSYFDNKSVESEYNNESTYAYMIKLKEHINEHVRSSYKVFRDLVAWETRYVSVLHKMYSKANSDADKLYFFKHIVDTSMEKDFRNDRLTDGDLFRYYAEYRDSINIDNVGKITCACNRNQKLTDKINEIAGHGSK